MRPIDLVVLHCSATPNGRRTVVEDIDAWHYQRGFRRTLDARRRQNFNLAAIGYHFLIYLNGAVATGRHLDEVGAHVVGNNRTSIGICLVGTDQFTAAQWASLARNIEGLAKLYGRVLVPYAPGRRREPGELYLCGHRDLSPDRDNDGLVEPWEWLKSCPGFDVGQWLSTGMTPPPAAVLKPPLDSAPSPAARGSATTPAPGATPPHRGGEAEAA